MDGLGNKITLVGRGKGTGPLIGQDSGGNWRSYTEKGELYSGGMSTEANDLLDTPKTHKVVGYVNVYDDGATAFHYKRYQADTNVGKSRIARKRIEFEVREGEFDD